MAGKPLIGVDDIATPTWAKSYESTANAGLRAVAREAPRTVATAVRWAWSASPRLTVLVGVLQLVTGAVTAFGLLATANVFVQLLEQGPTPERLLASLPAVAAVVGALAARGLLDAGVAAVTGALEPLVERRAEDLLHEAVIGVELAAFDDADFTELVTRAQQEGPNRISSVVRDAGDLVAALVSVAASVATAGVLQPLLAPVVLIAALPQGWASVRSARLSFASYVRTTSRRRRLGVTSHLITDRHAAAEVRAFTTQDTLLGEHRRIAAELTAEAVALNRRRTLLQLVGRTLSGVGTGVAYLVLGVLIYTGALALALAGAAAVAMRTASTAISRVVFETNSLYEASFALDIYRSCLAQAADRRRTGSGAAPADPAVITLDAVTFRYPDQDDAAVDGVSAVLRRGEVVALVGENGSGKSTLAKLITGLYLPDTGTVGWDGVDTREVSARALHDRVAVVMQDPLRWPMTAADNVRIGRLTRADPDDAALADTARRSGADDVVADLPAGWATVLSRAFQNGRDLSGGQWQRISVARGLYRDAPVVVADEPTAALDARAEHSVFAALRGLTGTDTITVLVTHRLSNVRDADQILVLEHGRLVEHGRHEELMAAGGVYSELFGIQARAYANEPG